MTASRWKIAAGVAALTYVARLLPAFVLPKEWGMRWFRLVVGDPSGGMGFAYVAQWLFFEVPLLLLMLMLFSFSVTGREKNGPDSP
jgi:hypothetical protein